MLLLDKINPTKSAGSSAMSLIFYDDDLKKNYFKIMFVIKNKGGAVSGNSASLYFFIPGA